MDLEQIEWLHVEASTKCNAWCPSCPRNLDGYGLTPGLEERDLSLIDLSNTFDKLPNLKTIQFCGNFGDPIAAKNFKSMINMCFNNYFFKGVKIQIHTNGSLKSQRWWRDLASLLTNVEHEVIFAIDGMKGTHEIYRQGTDRDKIINNTTAFINAGGTATWQFIPFKHNEQEVMFLMAESQRLGFKRFEVLKNVRLSKTLARDYKTGKEYKIEFYRNNEKVNPHANRTTYIDKKDCMHLDIKSVYLDANGDLYPCCYLANHVQYKNTQKDLSAEILSNPHTTCIENCSNSIKRDK